MFVYTVKGSKLKFTAAMVLSLLVLFSLVLLVPRYESNVLPVVSIDGKEVVFNNVRSDADRRAFLAQFGWTVSEKEPFYEEVSLPKNFDGIFTAYNELKKSQGLDLQKYGGKVCEHYRYEITNYESAEPVYANLIVYRGRVIGGDLSSAKMDGFVTTFFGKTG